ncbi:MAG: hypothetical protein AVDCRST_MAG38-1842, partial [uncultured Solirubrobacteraceae bacterium]
DRRRLDHRCRLRRAHLRDQGGGAGRAGRPRTAGRLLARHRADGPGPPRRPDRHQRPGRRRSHRGRRGHRGSGRGRAGRVALEVGRRLRRRRRGGHRRPAGRGHL